MRTNKLRVIIYGLFVLVFCFKLQAQNCAEISNWMMVLKTEYLSVQSGRAIPRAILQNMAVNLYSDKYYKSLTGKSFVNLSDKSRIKDWTKFQSCSIKDNYRSDPFKNWVFQTIIYNHQIDFRNTLFQDKVQTQNELREELEESFSLLKSDKLEAVKISQLRQDIREKYGVLLPSEIALVASLLDDKETSIADLQLDEKLEEIKALVLNSGSLNILKNFESANRKLFTNASDPKKKQIRAIIDEKIIDVLAVVMKDEVANIKQIDVNSANVKGINNSIIAFKKLYYSFMEFDETRTTLKLLQKRKTNIVDNMMSTINLAINETTNPQELATLENIFRKDLIENSSAAKMLDEILDKRKEYLAQKEAQIIAINEQKKEKEQRNLIEQIRTIERTVKFNVAGLTYAEFLDNIYRGHFDSIQMKNTDEEFYIIFTAYVRAFGKFCDSSLPKDSKVQIMDLVCQREETITDIYGNYKRSNCLSYGYIGSGIFARAELYETQLLLAKEHKKNFNLWEALEKMGESNATGNTLDRSHRLKSLANDLELIFQINECSSNEFRIFEKNLNRFAKGQSPIRMEQPSIYSLLKKATAPKAKQDYKKLVNDLILDLSESWSYNKFIPNSAFEVEAFDNPYSNLLVTLRAKYKYTSFGKTKIQYVTIKSKNGIPECVYFSDFPKNCKKPNKEILLNYVKGAYNLK